MLQTDYDRGTKDGDVLESKENTERIREQLFALAGKKSELRDQFHMYIDVVLRGLLFLPVKAQFHPLPGLRLKNFRIEVLDVVDVAVSKLSRFNASDRDDIRAMADKGLLDHALLLKRFKKAAEWFACDARAEDVPRYLKNFHAVERDMLALPESEIELPPECLPD